MLESLITKLKCHPIFLPLKPASSHGKQVNRQVDL